MESIIHANPGILVHTGIRFMCSYLKELCIIAKELQGVTILVYHENDCLIIVQRCPFLQFNILNIFLKKTQIKAQKSVSVGCYGNQFESISDISKEISTDCHRHRPSH